MSRWTNEEIFESYVNAFGARRVHWQRRIPFSGQVGHYYFLRRRTPASFEEMARITRLSSNAEVTLTRINSAYIIHIGNPRIATAVLSVPYVQEGIEEFQWIAHTHPLEQENEYQMIARGPTDADRLALTIVAERWNQNESTVIVCQGGRVINTVVFRVETNEVLPGGEIWTPDSH